MKQTIEPLNSQDYAFEMSRSWNARDGREVLHFAAETPAKAPQQSPVKESVAAVLTATPETDSMAMGSTVPPIAETDAPSTFQEPPVQESVPDAGQTVQPARKTRELTGFNQWLAGLQPPKTVETALSAVKTRPAGKAPATRGREHGGIYELEVEAATETLARLLVQQGYRAEAISVYQKLSIRHPEKKDIFADLIEKLKK